MSRNWAEKLATKQRNLFLYLALACFVGIIVIFVVDGYLGVYDTVYITAGEREEQIQADFWFQEDYPWSTGVNQGERIFFRYQVDNRRFSQYSADIEVSVWQMREKVVSVVSEPMVVTPFDKGEVEWTLDTVELKPGDIAPEQSYEFSIIIKRGETERRVILYVNPSPFPKLPIPAR